MNILLSVVLIIIGFALLIKGAEFLVNSSSSIAKRLHIPQIIIGLTIVSIGTTLPELLVSTSSAIKGYTDMALGNVIGSNICNLLLILGISTSIRRLFLKRETRYIEMPMHFFITIIFVIFCNTGNQLSFNESIVLLIIFISFVLYAVIMGIKSEKFDKEDIVEEDIQIKDLSIIKCVNYILLGIIILKIGGDFVVDNAVIIAEYFKISDQIISLTILAIGTSLPELVTSIVAAIKGNSDLSIGNILGANIFNMTLITPISCLINQIMYNKVFNVEANILLVASFILMLFPFIPPKNMISKRNGVLYLVIYLIYMTILVNT